MAEEIRPDRRIFDSRNELAKALAEAVARVLSGAIESRGESFLAVSGGSTPGLFLAELSRMPLDWSKVTVTLIDERLVPATSPRSNAALAMSKLLQGPAAAASFVGLFQEADSAEAAAMLAGEALGDSLYEAKLFVRGSVKSLGADCIEKEMRPEHLEKLAELLGKAGVTQARPEEFKRYGSARKLYNFNIDNADAY